MDTVSQKRLPPTLRAPARTPLHLFGIPAASSWFPTRPTPVAAEIKKVLSFEGGSAGTDSAEQDRIVPVRHGASGSRARAGFPQHNSQSLPERPFLQQIGRMDEPLESDLRIRPEPTIPVFGTS